ncbi:MAG: hypothetical protein HOM82_05495 [Thaumarchaeota archaeon]|jgi:hypothetical protein|nr:hypothetical protein [Nitrososphaerota archaeon]MDC0211888.1 hypothetical protein [Candidatus Nitrosopelagicus sp.]OUX40871.1 MAG: hypothetical protein CBE29_00795 [Rickettsiales bacterium TMED269]MBT3742992.1 hypothetical protein [Nitrososphaerota archaeon]MBT4056876.1 hypothetical protein [Nitrososphaerota archaeon]|tara:strand:+ start:867 stop:1358 length:492 start_codon:yes stop_codon:yes gene_type:complete
MRLSLFKISILLVIIGASGTGIIFSESDKIQQVMTLNQTEFNEVSLFFEAEDIAYYKITIPEFEGQGVFYRIVDEDQNTISKGISETKMSIRYFDVKESGVHTMIVTNLSQESMKYEIEIGSTDANKIIIPAGIMFVGGLLLLFTSFMKLKNYRTEQPDENIR